MRRANLLIRDKRTNAGAKVAAQQRLRARLTK
jgi:hypothetical protein